MKSIKWIIPLVAASALVVSGCSQMQQQSASSPSSSANRLTTGNAVGSGLSRSRNSRLNSRNRLGVTTAGRALGSGSTSRLGGGRTTSSFGGATTGAYGDGRGNLVNGIGSRSGSGLGGRSGSGIGGSGLGGSSIGSGGSLTSRGFGNTGSGSSGGFGSGSLDGGAGGLSGRDSRLGGSGAGGRGGASGSNGGSRIGGGAGGDYRVTDLNDPSSVLSRRVIYFAYDQSTIEPEYFEILDAHSELLASNPNLTVRLEGHADERGSREYNIALSERRAQAVKQFMDLKGVGSEQSQTVAYGEELPVDPGHNEAAWSKNRRVEIKYIGR